MKRAVLSLVMLLLLAVPARAAELSDALGLPEVAAAAPAGAAEAVGAPDVKDADFNAGLEALLSFAREKLPGVLRETLRPLAAIVAVTLLCAAAESFAGGRAETDTVAFAGCLAIAVIGVEDVRSVLRLGSGTLHTLRDFSRALLPTLVTAAAASGQAHAAGASWAAAALFSDLLISAAETVILPMLCGLAAAAAAAAVLGERRLDGAVQLLQWGTRTLLRALALCFTAYLGITHTLGAQADAAAAKTVKAVLTTALPVVGKLLSDASEAFVAGVGLLRSAIGVYGMLITLAAVCLPVLRLAARWLLFRAAAAVCVGVAGERQSRLIGRLSTVYGLLLGLVGIAAAAEFLSIISLIRTVV